MMKKCVGGVSFRGINVRVRGQDALTGTGGGFSVLPNDASAELKLAEMKAYTTQGQFL